MAFGGAICRYPAILASLHRAVVSAGVPIKPRSGRHVPGAGYSYCMKCHLLCFLSPRRPYQIGFNRAVSRPSLDHLALCRSWAPAKPRVPGSFTKKVDLQQLLVVDAGPSRTPAPQNCAKSASTVALHRSRTNSLQVMRRASRPPY